MQILAVANFKRCTAKTTSAYLAHRLALNGYPALAIDLDPQASLSAMFGAMDVQLNETIYAALRYDDERHPISEIIRPTYFKGIDLISGNIEVMEYEHETPRFLSQRRMHRQHLFRTVASGLGIVLGTPLSLGFLTLRAIYAAPGQSIIRNWHVSGLFAGCFRWA